MAESGSSAVYIAWLVRCGGGAGRPFAGSSSFSVAAARSIAAALISLAWAKAVVSPATPRSPKPDAVLIVGRLQPAVVEAESLARRILQVELAVVAMREMPGSQALGLVGVQRAVSIKESPRVGERVIQQI